ncbi:MAG TPA: hypothetical protein VG992_03465 [Candidatus Saccharimonadales bacterium]|nr:hypothetical protein [Candidatus Saccharimonadales bacterium]
MDKDRVEKFAEALGADFVAPVEEVLGVSAESLTHPLGLMAAGEAFSRRQARLREEYRQQAVQGGTEEGTDA